MTNRNWVPEMMFDAALPSRETVTSRLHWWWLRFVYGRERRGNLYERR